MTTRSLSRLLAGLLVIPAALLLIAARLTSGATSSPPLGLPSPAFDAGIARVAADDTAYFAGGCFWGIEGVYEHVRGVKSAVSGYSGGTRESADYDQVSSGRTGHAETVRVIYDPAQVSYGQLLHIFFSVAHDPTQLNRQGPDRGPQYRSAIFFNSAEQEQTAQRYIAQLTAAKFFERPIVTQLVKLSAFYLAEPYHQDYMVHHPNQPYIVFHDAPKVAALKRNFASLYKD
ncbi:MAG TPA: peptide-methionine (S)-S-oxide reductase MsrA [Gemmatimonadaceae bacterium]|nr:peptide-methionine (S)-S-oxide reductase MsrA [Gemmatimonadaceae bacterium]